MPDLTDTVLQSVLTAVDRQIDPLRSAGSSDIQLASTRAELQVFSQLLGKLPADAKLAADLASIETEVDATIDGTLPRALLGKVLSDVLEYQRNFEIAVDLMITNGTATEAQKQEGADSLQRVSASIQQIMLGRPDVEAVMADLEAMKNLRGGPADATAFHDFHVLQLAFRDVWYHAFDQSLKKSVEDLYTLLITNNIDVGYDPAALPASPDIAQIQELIAGLASRNPEPLPPEVWQAFGTEALDNWSRLTPEQQYAVSECAKTVNSIWFPFPGRGSDPRPVALQTGKDMLKAAGAQPQSAGGRLMELVKTISTIMNEKYAFDVFAEGSYNYGLLVTYRQRWEPGPYQAGNLAATIPLAPGETRRFTRRQVVKKTRAEKEVERSMSSRASQAAQTSRAEHDIMQRTVAATNFKMTASGSFNIGIGSIGSTTEFGANQEQFSAQTKKDFHEATLKTAEEYRLERSTEVDTSTTEDTEETWSGEISNPNNEITVTYLFYELQRRFKVHEFIYRVRPVILVAQKVPHPNEIDEAWLLEHQWIISRVLLDDSLRPALTYLASGFAGDELGVEVKRTQWETQRKLLDTLEFKAQEQLGIRDRLREATITAQLKEDTLPRMPGALKFFTFGVDPTEEAADMLEANRKALASRLNYAEAALADAQDKLKAGATALEAATASYSAALQNQFNRRVAIDQLRMHVKQNILYYVQAILDHEPPDQRFFRLYRESVICPQVDPECQPEVSGSYMSYAPSSLKGKFASGFARAARYASVTVKKICSPSGAIGGEEHELVEVADLDNPLGYKGNYMIFPLKHSCALTDYMMSDYINNYLGLMDADNSDTFSAEDFEERWKAAGNDEGKRNDLRKELAQFVSAVRRGTDEIIVPTGQLFIEALPGSHPLLEDFKLLHRAEDVLKVKAEVRHAELENLRLAARLGAGKLGDPDFEKQVLVSPDVNAAIVDS